MWFKVFQLAVLQLYRRQCRQTVLLLQRVRLDDLQGFVEQARDKGVGRAPGVGQGAAKANPGWGCLRIEPGDEFLAQTGFSNTCRAEHPDDFRFAL